MRCRKIKAIYRRFLSKIRNKTSHCLKSFTSSPTSEEYIEWDLSYPPDSPLLKYWEYRFARSNRRVARNIHDIYKRCQPVFESTIPGAQVFVHGSFARGLQTKSSDVNLFISNTTHKDLEYAWSLSELRLPRYENPSEQESIHEHLRDKLGRHVSICCSDDPWWWIKTELKYQIFPSLDEAETQMASNILVENRRPYLLKALRKCSYILRSIEARGCDIRQLDYDIVTIVSSSLEMINDRHQITMRPLRSTRLDLICRTLNLFLLQGGNTEEWNRWLPEFPIIPTWIPRLVELVRRGLNGCIEEDDPYWDNLAEQCDILFQEILELSDSAETGIAENGTCGT